MADPFDMFGPAASGARLVDFDRLKAAKQMGEIAMQPLQMEELRSQTEMQRAHAEAYRAKAQEDLLKAAKEKQFQALVQNAQGQLVGIEDGLDRASVFADLAIGAGMVEKGTDLHAKIATARATGAREAASLATAADRIYQTRQRKVETMSSLMADSNGQLAINTPEDLAAFNQLYSMTMKEPSPLAGYSFEQLGGREGLQAILNESVTTKDKLTLARQRERDEAEKTYKNTRAAQLEAQNEVRRAAQRTREAREARLAKGGSGKALVGPRPAEVSQAERLVKDAFKDAPLDDPKEAAYAIASEAQAMTRKLPGLSMDEALRKALLEAKTRGDFEEKPGLFGMNKKTVHVRGKVPQALPLPADRKQWKINEYYISPKDGSIAQWKGTGFAPVNPARSLSGDNTRSESSAATDDEDDDE